MERICIDTLRWLFYEHPPNRVPLFIRLCFVPICTARYCAAPIVHNLFGRLNFSAFAPRYCAARQGYPHEFSTIRPRFPQSYPQERELSSTVVSKTAAKCGKLRNLAVYRLVYVWISLWIMWKTLLTVSKNPANIPNFARL